VSTMPPRDAKGRFIKAKGQLSGPVIRRPSSAHVYDIKDLRGRYTALGYRSASVATREGRAASGASGEAHMQHDRVKLIHQSRDFYRNNGIYSGMIERAIGYIIANGFALQVKTENEDFNDLLERLWSDFWKRPEIKNIQSGRRVERMVCREVLLCGDTGAILTNQGLLQLIESEQIAGNKFASGDGINKNQYGTPTSFNVCPYGARGYIDKSKGQKVSVDDFVFITNADRPSATRGVPPCQAVFPMLHRINDVCDSEAIAWQLLARLALTINQEEGADFAYQVSKEDPDKSATDLEGDLATRITELDYALIFHARPGEKVCGVERNIPGRTFSDSLIMFLRLLGLPLGLPLEIILLDWTKSNYSQSRAVLEQAYQSFLGWQYLLEDFFHTPVLEWKIRQWQREGKLPKKDGIEFEWIKPTFPWIDKLKEAQAYGAQLDRGFTTHTQVCKSLNTEREDVIRAREQEVREAIEIAQKLTDEKGVYVPWEIFAGLRPPSENKGRPGGAAPATSSLNESERKETD